MQSIDEISVDQFESRITLHLLKVGSASSEEIIQTHHVHALRQYRITEVRADKASATGHQCAFPATVFHNIFLCSAFVESDAEEGHFPPLSHVSSSAARRSELCSARTRLRPAAAIARRRVSGMSSRALRMSPLFSAIRISASGMNKPSSPAHGSEMMGEPQAAASNRRTLGE